ncbi:MAG: hypothetical protein KAT13_01155, partial [Methanosarcinales archaeon]|nr:hypothetical protein [Methanosarcinales archaeon]
KCPSGGAGDILFSNNIKVSWSRMGFRSIRKNRGGGYVGELNTYCKWKWCVEWLDVIVYIP